MARIDVPTMQCDRCKTTTQDSDEMGRFQRLTGMYDGYSGSERWDLCPACWEDFLQFAAGELPPMHLSTEVGIQHDGR